MEVNIIVFGLTIVGIIALSLFFMIPEPNYQTTTSSEKTDDERMAPQISLDQKASNDPPLRHPTNLVVAPKQAEPLTKADEVAAVRFVEQLLRAKK